MAASSWKTTMFWLNCGHEDLHNLDITVGCWKHVNHFESVTDSIVSALVFHSGKYRQTKTDRKTNRRVNKQAIK